MRHRLCACGRVVVFACLRVCVCVCACAFLLFFFVFDIAFACCKKREAMQRWLSLFLFICAGLWDERHREACVHQWSRIAMEKGFVFYACVCDCVCEVVGEYSTEQ